MIDSTDIRICKALQSANICPLVRLL